MKRALFAVAVLLLAVGLLSAKMTAQSPAPVTDVNVALVRELHDLRVAIEKLANANTRFQVLSVRVTQQEQRVSNLTNQLIAMNSKLAEASAQMSLANSSLERMKEDLRIATDPKQREALEEGQKGLAMDFERSRVMQASLQAQADAIRQQIGIEQSTLADYQRRLEDLDRTMAEPRQ